MTGANDSFATLTFTYDADGEMQTAGTSGSGTGQPSVLLSYTYDPSGSETSVTDNLSSPGITTYTYDGDERVTAVASMYGGTAGPQVASPTTPAAGSARSCATHRRQRHLGEYELQLRRRRPADDDHRSGAHHERKRRR